MLVYTYALSPFSSAAVALLEAEGVTHKVVPLGGEWFLLGKRGSPIVTLTLTLSASVTLTLTLTLTLSLNPNPYPNPNPNPNPNPSRQCDASRAHGMD